jgi:hypothetical protein
MNNGKYFNPVEDILDGETLEQTIKRIKSGFYKKSVYHKKKPFDRKYRFSLEQVQEMYQMRQEGKLYREIDKKFGVRKGISNALINRQMRMENGEKFSPVIEKGVL